MKVKWIAISVGILTVLAIIYVVWDFNRFQYFGTDFKAVPEPKPVTNEWMPYKAIDPDDSLNVLSVTWTEKYGETKTVYCKVVFKNDKEKQYKLVAPWLGTVDIERANMDDIRFDRILKSSVPVKALEAE